MTSDAEAPLGRDQMTFEQAEGLEPLPAQLRLGEMSRQLRALLWFVFDHCLEETRVHGRIEGGLWVGEPWRTILRDKHVFKDHNPVDEFSTDYWDCHRDVKLLVNEGTYAEVLGATQWILRRRECPRSFRDGVNAALVQSRSPYRLLDLNNVPTIAPLSTDQERQVLIRAAADLARTKVPGAEAHLHAAVEACTSGQWADSIRDSIHAVEAAARFLEPNTKKLSDALARLERKGRIHTSLKKGFEALYGFTCDEQGIRHPLLEKGAAEVDETDALFMLGACAAFVSYLINRSEKAAS